MKIAYSYIRMSRIEQIKGQSLVRQLEASQRYAAEKGLTLDTRLRDLGVSAFTGENRSKGALGRFLSMVQAGEISPGSHLLVESLDRLSRAQVWVALQLFMDLINAGIIVHTLADCQVYSRESMGENSMQLIFSILVMARAYEESKRKSERVGDAWARKRREIASKKLTRRVPYWLLAHPIGDGTGLRFEIIEERAVIVRRIFTETADGMGQWKVAERLNRDNVPSFGRGKGWHASYIQKTLSDKAVLGYFQAHRKVNGKRVRDGEPVRNYYPAIVDAALYNRAKAARKKRRNPSTGGRKGRGYSNLFSGLCTCNACGGPLTYRDKGQPPKGGRYLVCDNALRGRQCTNRVHLRYDHLEKAVLDHVREFDFSNLVQARDHRNEQELAKTLADRTAELERLKETHRRYLDTFEADLSRDTEIADRVRNIRLAIEAKEREVASLNQEALHAIPRPPDAVEALITLRARLAGANVRECYALRAQMAQEIRSLVDKMVFDGTDGTVELILFMGVRAYLFRDNGKPPSRWHCYDQLGICDPEDHGGHRRFDAATNGDQDRAMRLVRSAMETCKPKPVARVR
jgi:DNA invertase Pin-like site-specific DNA recombinase